MTPDQIEAERVAFEAAYLKQYGQAAFDRSLLRDDEYDSGPTYHAWFGWLARAELAHERRAA